MREPHIVTAAAAPPLAVASVAPVVPARPSPPAIAATIAATTSPVASSTSITRPAATGPAVVGLVGHTLAIGPMVYQGDRLSRALVLPQEPRRVCSHYEWQ